MADANLETVVPESVETPETERITYSAAQQLHLEGLIKAAKSTAAKSLQAELARVTEESRAREQELSLYRDGVSPELVETRKQLATEKTARLSAEERQVKYETRALLREEASLAGVINPLDAARLLANNVVRKGTSFLVVDDNGEPRTSALGEPLQVRDLLREFAAERPWAVRSNVRPGSGSTLAQGAPANKQPKLSDLFGRASNGALALALMKQSPTAYRLAKKQAKAEGLIV
jgi:hypothetical protein